jgi:hypothetical protein
MAGLAGWRIDRKSGTGVPHSILVFDEGFDPVGGGEGYGPEVGGGAVEGEGYFEAMIGIYMRRPDRHRQRIPGGRRVEQAGGHGIDADDAAGFGLIGGGIGKSDDVTGSHGSDGEVDRAAVGVDHDGVAVDDALAFEEPKAGDDANLEEDALAAPAIANSGVSDPGGVAHLSPHRIAHFDYGSD